MKLVLELLRTKQWYKNLLVFLPIIFAEHLFRLSELALTALGFVALCLVSSSGYIINDIVDIEADRKNPEKRSRPIASGKIKVSTALIISIVLLFFSVFIAAALSEWFLYSVIALFLLNGVYSFGIKNVAFADMLFIATNFVIRAASGAFITGLRISPWLILCTFFLSLFLATGKRVSELNLLKTKAYTHRVALKGFAPKIADSLLTISTTCLLMSYSLYSFMSIYPLLILSLPFALYVIFRYLFLIYSGARTARHPEEVFKDIHITIGMALWLAVTLLVIYLL